MQHSEGDSENTESATESDSNGGASESESTITDSGPDDVIADQPPPKRPRGSRKSHRSLMSPPVSAKTSEDVVDLFLTAAEALKNNISPDVALHDHTYSLPPSQLVNNMDLQVLYMFNSTVHYRPLHMYMYLVCTAVGIVAIAATV